MMTSLYENGDEKAVSVCYSDCSGKGAEMTPDTLASKVDVCIVLVCTLCVFMCACVRICVCVHALFEVSNPCVDC